MSEPVQQSSSDYKDRMSDLVIELRGEDRSPWLTGKIDGQPVVSEKLTAKEFNAYMQGKVSVEDLGLVHFKNNLEVSLSENRHLGLSR